MVAISEPFAAEGKMHRLGSFLGFTNLCCNEAKGGKLWLFWRDSHAFEEVCSSAQIISGWVMLENRKTLLTFMYAKCTQVEQRDL